MVSAVRDVPVHSEYGQAVMRVRGSARALERGSAQLSGVDEEGLRHYLISGLAGAYPGRVSAESFVGAGKTDLLLQDDEGVNIVVGECKVWKGPMAFSAGLDQLLGYATRRDRGLLLAVFVRGPALSGVLDRGRAAAAAHPAVVEAEIDATDETLLRLVVTHPRDEASVAMVNVLFIEMASPRNEAISGAAEGEGLEGVLGVRNELLAAGGADMDYVVHAVGADAELPRPKGTLVRAVEVGAAGKLVIDAVATSERARSQYRVSGALTMRPGEVGDRARTILEEAIRWNIGAYVRRGAGVALDTYPPALEDNAERVQAADALTIILEPTADWTWPATLHLESDHGEAHVWVEFLEVEPEEGWDLTLRAGFHNVSLSYSMRKKKDGNISENFHWRIHPSDAPIRDRLAALDFLYASAGVGEMSWESHSDDMPDRHLQLTGYKLDRDTLFDRAFFGDIVSIADFTGTEIDLPGTEVPAEQVQEIGKAAAVIRQAQATVEWEGSTWRLPAPGPPIGEEGQDEMPLAIEAQVFGESILLGFYEGRVRYRVASNAPLEGTDEVAVTFSPIDADARVVAVSGLWRLEASDGEGENDAGGGAPATRQRSRSSRPHSRGSRARGADDHVGP